MITKAEQDAINLAMEREEAKKMLNIFDELTNLSELDRKRLKDLEAVIDDFLDSRWEAAKALTTIKQQKLYPQDTFKQYIAERWDHSRNQAYEMITWHEANEAAGTDENNRLSTVATLPLRKNLFTKQGRKKIGKVVKAARKISKKRGGLQTTAKDIKEAKQEVLGTTPAPEAKPEPTPTKPDYKVYIKVYGQGVAKLKHIFSMSGLPYKKEGQFYNTTTTNLPPLMVKIAALLDEIDNVEIRIKRL